MVLLPGATVTKEQEQRLAELLSGLGYASIALDQRNMGGSFDSANRIYEKALEPKAMHIVGCATHGRCGEMDPYIEEELARMVS